MQTTSSELASDHEEDAEDHEEAHEEEAPKIIEMKLVMKITAITAITATTPTTTPTTTSTPKRPTATEDIKVVLAAQREGGGGAMNADREAKIAEFHFGSSASRKNRSARPASAEAPRPRRSRDSTAASA